jgi:hypothetical protein
MVEVVVRIQEVGWVGWVGREGVWVALEGGKVAR